MALTETGIISIVGITVSGVVGPGVAAWWAKGRQVRDHQHEREFRRNEDLAALLDDAAKLLAPGATKFRGAQEAAKLGNEGDPRITDWASEIHATYERMLLRIPEDHPVCVAYLDARTRLVAFAEALEAESTGDAEVDEFETARSAFLKAARDYLRQLSSLG